MLGTTPPPVRRNDTLQRSLEAIAPEPSSEVIYAIPVRSPLQRLRGHTHPVSAADWLSTGDQVASGGSDNVVRIWSAETGATVAQVPAGSEEGSFITNITTLSVSTVLAASCADGYFRVYDVRTLGKPLYESRSAIAPPLSRYGAYLAQVGYPHGACARRSRQHCSVSHKRLHARDGLRRQDGEGMGSTQGQDPSVHPPLLGCGQSPVGVALRRLDCGAT